MSMLAYFFSFYGRIGRGKFWLGLLIVIVVTFGAVLLFSLIKGGPANVALTQQGAYNPDILTIILFAAVGIISNISALALSVKRLHDRGQSGWWYLLTLIPIVGMIWYLVNLGFLPGEKGPNKYGPDPRGRIDQEIFA